MKLQKLFKEIYSDTEVIDEYKKIEKKKKLQMKDTPRMNID